MKNKKKTLLMSLAAVLLVVSGVFGTLAYLTSITDTVENTFTVGNVKIKLDEVIVDDYGTALEDGVRTSDGQNYKLIPGRKIDKDPMVTVTAGSEESFIFMKLNNELPEDIKLKMNDEWVKVDGKTNIYKYQASGMFDARELTEDKALKPLFDGFDISEEITNKELEAYKDKKIAVTAYAIQADGLKNVEAALEKLGL